MKIIEKIEQIRAAVEADPVANAALGAKMQALACLAVEEGIKSRAWEEYMRIFASNPEQLQRLTGKDEAYNQTRYGKTVLAYMVANGCCGIETKADTGRGLNNGMQATLDSLNLNDANDPAFA